MNADQLLEQSSPAFNAGGIEIGREIILPEADIQSAVRVLKAAGFHVYRHSDTQLTVRL